MIENHVFCLKNIYLRVMQALVGNKSCIRSLLEGFQGFHCFFCNIKPCKGSAVRPSTVTVNGILQKQELLTMV